MLNSIHKKPKGNYATTASNNLHSLQTTIWYWNASIAPDISLLINIGNKKTTSWLALSQNTTIVIVNGYHRNNQIKKQNMKLSEPKKGGGH